MHLLRSYDYYYQINQTDNNHFAYSLLAFTF